MTPAKYRALVGFNYRPHPDEAAEVRVDADEVVFLPAEVVKELEGQGVIEHVKAKA